MVSRQIDSHTGNPVATLGRVETRAYRRRTARPGVWFAGVILCGLIGTVVTLSFVGVLSPDLVTKGVRRGAQMLRWPLFGLSAITVVVMAAKFAMSTAAKAWLVGGFWALGTVSYSFDEVPTVLRGVAFVCTVLTCFWGAELLARSRDAHLLVELIRFFGKFFAWLAIISSIVFVVAPSQASGNNLFRGVFGHPNALGVIAANWLPIPLMLWDKGRSRYERWLGTAGFVIGWAELVMSKSRTGIGSAMAACVVYFVVTRKVTKTSLLLVGSLSIVGLSLVVAPDAWRPAGTAADELIHKGYQNDILHSRRDLIETGLTNIQKSPWFGYGFGTSIGENTDATEWKLSGLSGREKSNVVVAVLEEVGVVGAAVLFTPVIMFFVTGLRLRKIPRPVKDPRLLFGIAAYAAALGGIMANSTEATLWSPGAMYSAMTLFLAGSAGALLSKAAPLASTERYRGSTARPDPSRRGASLPPRRSRAAPQN
jgi:hypothetical protein